MRLGRRERCKRNFPRCACGETSIEDVGVEEDPGAGGLVLGGGGEPAADDEVVEEGFDVGGAKVGGVAPRAVVGSTE